MEHDDKHTDKKCSSLKHEKVINLSAHSDTSSEVSLFSTN